MTSIKIPRTASEAINNLVDEDGNRLMDCLDIPGQTGVKIGVICYECGDTHELFPKDDNPNFPVWSPFTCPTCGVSFETKCMEVEFTLVPVMPSP
jgi:hypothetical protein